MKPHRFPLPWWHIADAPALQTSSGPVHKAVTYIAMAYWRSHCVRLPSDDVAMAILARLPLQHFKPIKAAVLAALGTITPELDKAHVKLMVAHRAGKARSDMMHAAKARKRAGKLLARSAATAPQVPFALPTRLNAAPANRPPFGVARNGHPPAQPQPGPVATFRD